MKEGGGSRQPCRTLSRSAAFARFRDGHRLHIDRQLPPQLKCGFACVVVFTPRLPQAWAARAVLAKKRRSRLKAQPVRIHGCCRSKNLPYDRIHVGWSPIVEN